MTQRTYTQNRLRRENRQFADSGGRSGDLKCCTSTNRTFVPAFRNDATGEVALSRLLDGRIAPIHLIINLPAAWAIARNARGQISAVCDSVVAGFVRDGQFFTRAEAAACANS